MYICTVYHIATLSLGGPFAARPGDLSGPEDRTLIFESRFESGNLRRAVQAYEFESPSRRSYLNPKGRDVCMVPRKSISNATFRKLQKSGFCLV